MTASGYLSAGLAVSVVGARVLPLVRKGVVMAKTTAQSDLHDAIGEFVGSHDPGAIVTGWVLSISVKHPTIHSGDGYISLNSEGLPYHSQIGLLHAALEEKNTSILLGALKDSGHGGD